MEIKQIDCIQKHLKVLWAHDQLSQAINFPDDKPNYKLFKRNILLNYEKQPEGFLLLWEGNRIIGSMVLTVKYNPYRQHNFGEIWYIYIDEFRRNMGYGTRLIEYADQYFKKLNCTFSIAGISAFNPASNALFSKHGYEIKRHILEKTILD